MTSAVLFDFYGTLARAVQWREPFRELLARHGLLLDPDARARWQAEAADGIEHGEASIDRDRYVAWERARLCRLVAGCGAADEDIEPVAAELYDAMKTYTMAAYDEVPGVLEELRDRGVLVAVCSNWDWDLDRALAQAGLDHLVDVAVTSAQAGARKPHPRIYAHTLERCGLEDPGTARRGAGAPTLWRRAGLGPRPGAPEAPASTVWFVGDTWGPDVEGPLAAGLRPVHIWRAGEPGAEGDPPALFDGVERIPDLRGVLPLLAGRQPERNESRT